MAFTDFPVSVQPLLQQNMLARFVEEGLDSELAYRMHAIVEQVPIRTGQTMTMTRNGRKAPVSTPLNAQTLTAFDNGLSPSTFSVEQYSYNIQTYGDTTDVNLMGELAGIADQFRISSRNSGVQGAQSLERVAKNRLFGAYNTANTFVTTFGGTYASSSTTCHVDDIRGFQVVSVNGELVPVSPTNPLVVQESASTSGGVTQTLSVTAAVADANNVSSYPSDGNGLSAGISGTLTFASATDPVNGDALVAANAPQVLRPAGKLSTNQLAGGDVFSWSLIQDAVEVLRNNAVPPFPDGTYHLIMDNTSQRQLYNDQDFKLAMASRIDHPEYRDGRIFILQGCTFITTTEAYVQAPNSSAGVNVKVRRPILMGAESLLQGNFAGLEGWLNRDGFQAIGNIVIVDGVAQIIRPPLDRLQMTSSLSWMAILDFAVPTDITCNTSIVPTSSNALYKRCVAMEHAG